MTSTSTKRSTNISLLKLVFVLCIVMMHYGGTDVSKIGWCGVVEFCYMYIMAASVKALEA